MIRYQLKAALLAAMLAGGAAAFAQSPEPMKPIAAPKIPNEIPLGTHGVEGSTAPESWFIRDNHRFVRNVTSATLTPVLTEPGKANGAAVIVAPGGGFVMLSMENEGWLVAKALADRGIAAFVLKYRIKPTPADMAGFEKALAAMYANAGARDNRLRPDEFVATTPNPIADARAAFALVRANAAKWRVDPERIGMMGFSAGAMTTMITTLGAPEVKPAFIAPIYGSMEAVTVPKDAPPMFAVITADDPLFAHKGFGLLDAWQAAGRPVEFHMYEKGGHGFGLGRPGTTTEGWFDGFIRWLDVSGFLKPRR
jgi:acetyl esterase/lipase